MPKIIEDLKTKILIEAKRQIFTYGYINTTIRSVSKECGIAAGTIYNYYPSKDYLIAAFILEDWMALLEELKGITNQHNSVQAIKGIYLKLMVFNSYYEPLFREEGAKKSMSSVNDKWHKVLRMQLAEIIKDICFSSNGDVLFLPEYIAESLLAWSSEGRALKDIETIMNYFFKEKQI